MIQAAMTGRKRLKRAGTAFSCQLVPAWEPGDRPVAGGHPGCYDCRMRKSSIAKHLGCGPGSPSAVALWERVREQRRRRGLTQSELGHPLSRSYVSALEKGLTLPSLGTLWLLSDRLGVSVAELIDGATSSGRTSYTSVNDSQTGDDANAPRPRSARAQHREAHPAG